MATFLEIYRVLLGFVNFKLFHSIGMSYPLKIDAAKVQKGILFGAIMDAQNKSTEEPHQTRGKDKTQNKVSRHYLQRIIWSNYIAETTTKIGGSFSNTWRHFEKTRQHR